MSGFSISSILAGLVFGIIGFWLLREGRKRSDPRLAVIGVLLMAYTYFTPGFWLLEWGIGIGLCYAAHAIWN